MSSHRPQPRLSTLDIRQRHEPGSLVVLTAYSAPMARLLDPHVDVLLVGIRWAWCSTVCRIPWLSAWTP